MLNKEKLPMVAYIHGGSLNFGNNNKNFDSLVEQGVVVVSINYRLGPYGFLHLKSTEEGAMFRGNWALQDQHAGLMWISMFGGVFGGNKNIVTLDGCSAGSASGWHHMTQPMSWPYFNRMMSNGIGISAGRLYEGVITDVSMTNRIIITVNLRICLTFNSKPQMYQQLTTSDSSA